MRYYRCWAGNEQGTPEDPRRCVVEVADGGRSVLSHQCDRPRGHGEGGLLCKQHSKLAANGRQLWIPIDAGHRQGAAMPATKAAQKKATAAKAAPKTKAAKAPSLPKQAKKVVDKLEKASEKAASAIAPTVKAPRGNTILGHQAGGIIRLLGAEGKDLETAKAVNARFKIHMADRTIATLLYQGRSWKKTPKARPEWAPAPVTLDQVLPQLAAAADPS